MARGIEIPIKPKNGRMKLLSGDGYISQLVAIALGDNDSDNPFQDIGLGGERFVFAINNEMTEGEIRERVLAVFESLERDQLAKVKKQDITFEVGSGGELRMNIVYTNIETQERPEIEVPIPPQGD
jgi:hypothetical protein